MTFNVDVVLKGRDLAVTQIASIGHGDPASWNDEAVRDVLVQMLRAIDRVEHPDAAADRPVALRGFSWVVQPTDGEVVIAIEIPMGAAVAGPFAIRPDALDAMISRVLQGERGVAARTIH